ncbi:hypothetical protein CAC42_2026 [Neofusicoccum parvum]|uniref:Uncharacterized protein n=1 Tax=Neofusicoccum parvum TaxID=310453 RepID=A0ACB5SPN4_9PEZI|nr:hypothetical protein CAC42_2026 [Neofusicoccum parvum]
MRYTGRNQEEDSKSEQINSEVIVDFEQAYVDRITRPVAIDFDDDVIMHDYREVDEIVPGNTHCKEDGCCTSDLIHCDYDIDNDLREKHYKHGYDSPMLEARSEIETDKDRRLLPSQVHGFVLKKRKWATLSTAPSSLKEVESLNFWKDLVLDSTTKDLVEAQVMQHLQKAEDEKKEGSGANLGEFISGKGRSLVILLHGPPGVGKTSTAECIADHVKKPLYSLTSGNLGVDPDTIEQKLENHFNLAAKWGCILLLDEADVFLQQRKHTNLNINAIVSVFLRQLEYYSGVLFLTTNRLGDIDRAFKSRIHVALEYKRFNKRTTWKVYKLCLDRLQTQYDSRNRELDIKYDAIRDWAKKHFLDNRWNGREIFNACQTAIALAEWDVKKGERKKLALKVKHFDKVAEASRGFEKYLNDLRDEEANEAWRARTRIDDENLRGRVPQGSLNLLGTPTPSAKKPSRKAASDDDDDDDDDSDIGKKGGKKAKKQRDKSDDDSSDSD